MHLFEQVLEQMEQKLYALDDQNQDKVNYYRKAITITSQSLLKLKELIIPTRSLLKYYID